MPTRGPRNAIPTTYLFILFIHSLRELLLQQHHDLLNVLARNHLQSDSKSLSPDINVRAGKNTQDFHGQFVQDSLVANAQLVNAVQYNELDIVVCLPNRELDQFTGGGLDGDGIAGKGSERRGGFVDDGTGRGIEQLKHQLEVS